MDSRLTTDQACLRIAPATVLANWPAVPFDIPITGHSGGRIRFFKTYNKGTPSQGVEAQQLLEGEINYLETHAANIGPREINVEADFTTLWLSCHAYVEPRSRWSNQVAIDTLKSLQTYIKAQEGFEECEFDVTDATSWLANCKFFLHPPSFPGVTGATQVS